LSHQCLLFEGRVQRAFGRFGLQSKLDIRKRYLHTRYSPLNHRADCARIRSLALQPTDILHFWFTEITPQNWWQKDPQFDAAILRRFAAVHREASLGLLYKWRETAEGALAEIIVLDQFSRNMYRDKPAAFAQDPLALVLAQEAVRRGLDQLEPTLQRAFYYRPFQHSEALSMQEESLRLFSLLGDTNALDFAARHKAIIDRFGRFPHRNLIVGRSSTEEEEKFLQEPGSAF
jgi:uncharacterized protein (DUF924 family)